jgi:hypothetical protein
MFETPVSAAIKSTIEGTFGLAGKVVEAAGNTVRGVGEAVGGALEGALSPAPVTIINGVGMAGQAGKSKVSGSGTIPASSKKSGRPAVNPNMPTEKLLVVAVNYLSSIEKTLEQQLQFERRAFQQQAQAEKEASIESGGSSFQNPFSNLGEKLDAIKDNAKERAGTVGKLLIGAGLLGALGLGALGNLDTSQLEELKSNWAAFTDKISPIIRFVEKFATEMGTTAMLAAGAGFTFGGIKGGIIGLLAGKFYSDAYGEFNPETNKREGGKGLISATLGLASNLINPITALVLAPVATLKYAYKGIKTIAGAVTAFTKRQAARFLAWFEEKAFVRFAFSAASKNRLWNIFLKYLERKAGQRILAQLAATAAAAATATAAEAAAASTVIGVPVAAVSAVVTKLLAAGFTAWLLWDLYQIWVEFFETPEAKAQLATEDERANASPVSTATTPDAAPASTTSSSSAAPASNGAALPAAAAGSIDAILDKNPESLSDAELRQLVEAQGRIEDPRGVMNNPGGIRYGTGPLQDHQIGFRGANADNSVKIAVYDTPENGIRAAMENWRTSRYYKGHTVRDGLGMWSTGHYGRNANYEKMLGSAAPGYTGTTNPQGESGSMLSSLGDLTKGGMEAIGIIAKATFGKQRAYSGSQLGGFNDNMQGNAAAVAPNNAATVAPNQEGAAGIAQLSRISAQIQTAADFGAIDKTQAETKQQSAGATLNSKPNSSNDDKRDHFDPNYPGQGSLDAYVQYHKLAA